nr:right-handed parallel beta-helix repeat-containing protein [uncultured Carboxylicivirga sp.]
MKRVKEKMGLKRVSFLYQLTGFFLLVVVICMSCSSNSPAPEYNPGGDPAEPPFEGQSSYTIELDKWNIDNTGHNAEATTNNLQAAIDWAVDNNYDVVNLPAGIYLVGIERSDIYTGGIELHDSLVFQMDDNAEIRMKPHDRWNASAISITGKSHVVIRGGTIRGDRNGHIFTPRPDGATAHDEGHNITIQNESAYVLIDHVTLTEATGDGILMVGQSGEGSSVTNVTVRNCNIFNNRRQGISIVGGVRVLIEDNEIHHTNGTAPQFGIDIESLSYESKDIIIRKNYFHHNAGGDFVNADGRNVLFENNTLEEGDGNRNIDGPIVFWKNADQTIRNNTMYVRNGSVNGKVGIIGYSNNNPKTNSATSYILNNYFDGCGLYVYKSADMVIKDNTILNGYVCVYQYVNLTIENNEVYHDSKCWAWRFKEVYGTASGNTYGGEPFDIPLKKDTPYNGCWID